MNQYVMSVGRGRVFHNNLSRYIETSYRRLYDLERKLWWLPASVRDQLRLAMMELKPIAGGSASNAAETDILELIFNATAWPELAQDDGTSPATNITVALHTADPGETGTQATTEANYTSYARVNVARTSGGWTVGSGSVSPVANITFPTSTGAGTTMTHFSVGTGTADYLIASGAITPTIPVGGSGVPVILSTATAITCD